MNMMTTYRMTQTSVVLFLTLLFSYQTTITSAFAATLGTPGPAFTTATTATTTSTTTSLSSATTSTPSDSIDTEKEEPLRTVLVTGGCGYIGSHTCLELLQTGHYRVVVVDNLDNSSTQSLERVKELANLSPDSDLIHFRQVDIRDAKGLNKVLEEFSDISSCIHFAGLKAVGESVSKPLMYYQTNIGGTCTLLECLEEKKIQHFVFSSSATVSS